ncbi:MAG: S8 family serine peptidase, partial [Nitrospirota bacterium]|nr:S8 family serine peptidase [Nitrospirota bacterium]
MKAYNRIGVVFLFIFFLTNSIAFAAQGHQKKVEINGFVIDVKKAENDDTQIVVGKDKDKNKKWIVQFTGPIREADKKQLLDLGCRISDYVPEFAFIVTMDEKTQKKVEKLPFIEGAVRYKPEYKIEKSLREKVGKKEIGKLHIRVDSAENLPVLLSAVLRKKGEILDAGKDVARVKVDPKAISQLASLEEVLWIEEAVDLKLLNDISKWTIQTYIPDNTKIWDNGILGEWQIVGIGDTGLDYDMPWFYDPSGAPIGPTHRKVAGYASCADDYDGDYGHGTHVAGTVGGYRFDGLSDANGMAPMSRLYIQDITPGEEIYVYPPSDLGIMFMTPYYAGARLHTNSWGADYNGYETYARTADRFMWEHKDFLALFASGNSGDGAGSVDTPATAKNVVSVGASENGLNAENVAWFSSNGPAADGRIKPTVIAPGVNIVSADSDGIKNSFNSGTVASSGTSMATPAVAGAAALVRQYYADGYWPYGTANAAYGFVPSAALVKATLINSAQNMTGNYTDAPIPSTGQGWGRINLDNTLYFFGDKNYLDVSDVTNGLTTGALWRQRFFSTAGLKVTLVWTDYPGTEGAAKSLVNDLDLSVTTADGSAYIGNVFQNGVSVTGGTADELNVEEQIFIPAFQSGVFDVTVTGYNVPFGPQPFALVVTGGMSVTSKGFIYLDNAKYNGSGTVRIEAGDRDLNLNSSAIDTVSVSIKSGTEPGGESVQLFESGMDTAIFIGAIDTRSGAVVPGNSHLEVSDGDTITATYYDANDGTGSPAYVMATAIADLIPPIISAVAAGAVSQDSATVSWTANEPSSASIHYGETKALGAFQTDPWLMTSQVIKLGNLREATSYYYEVYSTDEAGNVRSADNGGVLYTFTTLNLPPALTVNSSNFTETYQSETVIYGTATDPSGVVSVTVNGQAAAYRPSDGYYELSRPLAMGDNLFTVAATDTLGNSQTINITVTRLMPPDLVINSVAGPSHGGWAEPIHLENMICNAGLGKSLGTGWVGWYLSTDEEISRAEDIKLSLDFKYLDDIAPGKCISVPVDIRLSVPVSLIASTYYMGAYVDISDEVWESDETNNMRAGNQMTIEGPDLIVSSLSAPQSAVTGTEIIVANTVSNTGLGASWGFYVGIYLSTDAVITLSDTRIGRRYIDWLEPAGSPYPYPSESGDDTVVTIPDTVPEGTYYIGLIADYRNSITESNESNNVSDSSQIGLFFSSGGVVVNPTTVAVTEGGATATYSVVLTSQPSAAVTIAVTAEAGKVTVNKSSLSFTTTNWNVAQAVTVTAVDDTVAEGPHTGTVTHSASGGGYSGVAISSVTANITDNDTAGVVVNPTTVAVTEGGATATYSVVLTSQPSAAVTIAVT